MFKIDFLRWEIARIRWVEALMRSLLAGALTALGARIAVPLPGTPVPMTLQVLGVLLAGMILDGKRGALGQLLYLAAGVAGLPVFASTAGPQALLGPTGGYLIAFPAAAFIVGALSHRFNHLAGRLLAALAGVGAIYAGGTLWLALWLGAAEDPWGIALARAWRLGAVPFILVDLAKSLLAALIAGRFTTMSDTKEER
ncbi:MAG: biotin transporter BioY [Chloroflexota bacterium]|nr:biotin transporter BioY [Chloroflexota bacterium]